MTRTYYRTWTETASAVDNIAEGSLNCPVKAYPPDNLVVCTMRIAQRRLTPRRKSGDEFVGEAIFAYDTQNRATMYFVSPI